MAQQALQSGKDSVNPPIQRFRLDTDHPGNVGHGQTIPETQRQDEMVLAVERAQRVQHEPAKRLRANVALALLRADVRTRRRIKTLGNGVFSERGARASNRGSALESLRPTGTGRDVGVGADSHHRFGSREAVAGNEALEPDGYGPHPGRRGRRPPPSPFAISLVEKHAMQHDRQIRAEAAATLESAQDGVVVLDELDKGERPKFVQLVAADAVATGYLSHDDFDQRQI